MAQEITGSIVGTVQDPTGAAVPGAKVTVTNTDRNAVIRTATTDTDGNYSAPLLPVGHYSVAVEARGFKKSVQRDIMLNVSDKLTINLALVVGDVQQEVNVAANPVQVELQAPAPMSLMEGNQIRELSLNARNYEQLVALQPGVTNTATGDQIYVGVSNPLSGQSNAVTFAINGGRTDQNNWTIDGADNVDRGANLTLLNYPSVDSIAEFRVIRGEYSAEYGRNAGGNINVITKSGTNAPHFNLYEFFRNDKLAANNFFTNLSPTFKNPDGTAKVPPLRYNDFGGTLGGPVYIPKVYNGKDKTFFFFSEEVRRVITYTPVQGVGPTAGEKQGIFAKPVCVAFTGSTCTQEATQIPNIDPVAQAYIKDIFSQVPDATSAHVLNLALRNVFDARQENIKVDHSFSQKWVLSARYIQDAIPTIEPRGLFTGASLPNVSTTSTNSPGRGLSFHLTNSISASLVNEVGYAYSYGAVLSDPIGLGASVNSPDINLKLPFTNTLGRVPSLSFGGISAVTGFGPYRDYNRNHNWFDNITKIMGRHTLKAGVSINKYEKRENAAGNNTGTFTFATTPRAVGGDATTQGWANFLLGNVSNFSQVARDITPDIHQNQAEMYVQDDFRVRRNLTLNLGVRYGLFRQPTDGNGFLNTFDPSAYNPAKAPQITAAGNLVPGTGDPLNGFIVAGKNSPFGSKISNENYHNFAPRLGIAWDPFGDQKTSIRAGYGIAYDTPPPGRWEDPITANPPSVQSVTYTNTTFASITSGTVPPPTSPPSLTAIATHYQTPYMQQWSFDIQRELPSKSFLDVGYFGSKGTHLVGEPDINQLPPGLAVALGITTANVPLTTTTDPKVNGFRPFVGYRAINVYETWFNSNYNSLQATFKKQFANNGFLGANYTFAKEITDAGTNAATPQNFYNRAGDRGFSPFDRTHVFSSFWSYELPFLKSSKGLLKAVAAEWQISGILSVASGLPFNASDSSLGTDPGGLGILGAGSGATPRADTICNPNAGAPHLFTQWFNTQCLAEVPAGVVRPGNSDRNTIRGPGYQKWDWSLFKNFTFKERGQVQFRAETFNAFNHTNWSSIGATLGSSTYGTVTAARDARVVQFGLKLSY
ncbi:MAG: carboxypeptidase regulatory-like domain-containing protein [Acidobacteriia bacterium]|nr:carboxypeptidase regulatory-like domain-containing protein [Terriglobia bacterium]